MKLLIIGQYNKGAVKIYKFSGENVFDGHVCVPAPLQGHDGPSACLLSSHHSHPIGHGPHYL